MWSISHVRQFCNKVRLELRFSYKMCSNPLSKSSRLRHQPGPQFSNGLFYLSMKRYINVYIYVKRVFFFFPPYALYIYIMLKRVFILLFHSAPLLNCRQVDVIFHVHVMVLVRTMHTKAKEEVIRLYRR